MATTVEEVLVLLRASVAEHDRRIQAARRNFAKEMGGMGASAKAAEKQIKRSADAIGSRLKLLAGTIAGAFTGRELVALTDAFTEFQNRLKVAGVEGDSMKTVQDALFASAQRYGVELGALGSLYSRAAQAATTLGASQSDLLKFTDNVSAAIKVQGGSVQQASGALLQLSQALQAGTVRAEEFNSINEGLLPVLQAVAAGSDRFGGSVAKLRKAVLDGTVTSREFFAAFQKGSSTLEQRATKATLTTAAALTTLNNALTVYFGEADKANGVSAALATAIGKLADNLDTIIPAVAVLAGALGVGMVTNAIAARVAIGALGTSLLTAFGGPIGVAITAVTVGIVYLASRTEEAAKATGEYAKVADELKETQAESASIMDRLAVATGKARDEAVKAAKTARDKAKADLTAAEAALIRASAEAALTRESLKREVGFGVGSLRGAGGGPDPLASNAVKNAANAATQADANYRETEKTVISLQGEIAKLNKAIAAPAPTLGLDGDDPKTKKTKPGERIFSSAERRMGDDLPPVDLPISLDADKALVDIDKLKVDAEGLKQTVADLDGVFSETFDADLSRRLDEIGDAFENDLSQSLADVIVYGDDLGDSLESAFKRVASAMLQAIIQAQILGPLLERMGKSGGSGGGGFFGSLLSSIGTFFSSGTTGKATGGAVHPFQRIRVGEHGPEELRMGNVGGYVSPMPAGRGGGSGAALSVTINAPGATAETVTMIRREINNVAPSLINAASNTTLQRANRRTLPRGIG